MIQIKDLTVEVGGFRLAEINLNVQSGEYLIILGPTGAGKTVLLETVAGLYPVLSGTISVDGREITDLRPEKRKVAIVYQDQALFPHLSVEQNIAFGLKLMKSPRQLIHSKVSRMAELLGITDLLRRLPGTLSGGERQKAALARALITEPEVLLLDEPLSALDVLSRERMQRELAEMHRRLTVTTIHVTHDFEEAMALGDRVAIMNQGQIAQVGTADDILRRPSSEFVANFTMCRNVFSGETCETAGGTCIDVSGNRLAASTELRGSVHLSLRPEDILVSTQTPSPTAENHLSGTVTEIDNRGAIMLVTVTVPPAFVCLVTRPALAEMSLQKGMSVWITFKASAVHVF
ncbi:MAG: ABC transporter ATP-binding protein [Chloroflexi bacterium]|nr:ABC transporter ATP-binding protein [Chloroflexota bacterium]